MRGHTDKHLEVERWFDLDKKIITVSLFTNGGDFYTVATRTEFYDKDDMPTFDNDTTDRKSFRGGTYGTPEFCMVRAEKHFDKMVNDALIELNKERGWKKSEL
jgi:hypothetical protein